MDEIENCICGNKIVHSNECKRKNSYFRIYEKRKKIWKTRVEKKCCGDCGIQVKPKIIYPARCDKCNKKSNGKKCKNGN